MLIVPLDSRYSQGRKPWATIFLIAVNTLIFLGWQVGDENKRQEAYGYYVESGLFAMEYPQYLEELRQQGKGGRAAKLEALRDESAAELEDQAENPEQLLWPLFGEMMADAEFRQRLQAGTLVRPEHARYGEWKPLRNRFESLNAGIVTDAYSFNPDQPTAGGLLGHMFLHGSWDHLLGNMVVLALSGALVEYALGPLLFLGLYLLSGLAAVAAYWLVNLDGSTGLVGASGAISGAMGMFAVFYGRRKVRFFYTILVYFDFILLPAIVLLPYWVAWEVLQSFRSEGQVAYEAHAGGLIGGALLALAFLKRVPQENQKSLDKPAEDARYEQELQQGLLLMSQLKFDRARPILDRVHLQRPDDTRPLVQLYRIARADPASDAFHRHAQALLVMRVPEMDRIFDDYWKTAKPQPSLEPRLMVLLLKRYAAATELARVDALVVGLARAGYRDRIVAAILDTLAARVDEGKAQSYRTIALKHFSGNSAG